MRQAFEVTWAWVRVQFFRFWTALAVLGTYGYLWIDRPGTSAGGREASMPLSKAAAHSFPIRGEIELNRRLAISGFGSK